MSNVLDPEFSLVVEESSSKSGRSLSTMLAAVWTATLSLWVALGFVQLPAAAALIELEGLKRGRPVTADDHFSNLPELQAAFDTANLSFQHPFLWIILMPAFAISGLLIGAGLFRTRAIYASRILLAMSAIWGLGILLAVSHRETLDLVMWLTN